MRTSIRALCVALILGSSGAAAEPVGGIVSEVKLGLLAHDLRIVAADPVEKGADINAEVLFVSPALLEPLWAPRPHLGVQVNTRGDTSQVYAGVTWTFDLTDSLWLGLSGGGTLHNGETLNLDGDRKALGSRALFRLAAELGVNVTDNVSLSVYFDHESNAFLAERNPGIDNVGARVSWRF
jgi:lipid A 3-O-deacylase